MTHAQKRLDCCVLAVSLIVSTYMGLQTVGGIPAGPTSARYSIPYGRLSRSHSPNAIDFGKPVIN